MFKAKSALLLRSSVNVPATIGQINFRATRVYSQRWYSATVAAQPSECSLEFLTGEDKGIVVMNLKRHATKNALGKQMINEMVQNLQQVRFAPSDSAPRVLIIKSEVPKAFCTGADLKERAGMTQQEAAQFVNLLRNTFTDIEVCTAHIHSTTPSKV